MKPLVCRFLIVGFLVAACGSSVTSEEEFLRDGWPFGYSVEDLSDLADSLGESIDDVRVRLLKEEVMMGVVRRMEEQRPGVVEKWVLGENPYDPPTIYLRGPADADAQRVLDGAPIRILVVDNLPFPTTTDPGLEASLRFWAERVRNALWEKGYRALVSGVKGLISVRVETLPWLPVSEGEVLDVVMGVVPPEFGEAVEVTVDVLDAPAGLDWGPMAVTTAFDSDAEGFVVPVGRLRITDRCVVVEDPTLGDTLILWSSRFYRWDSDSRTVVGSFDEPEVASVVLGDGDPVEIVGRPIADYTALEFPMLWVAEPDPECPTQALLVAPEPPRTCTDRPHGFPAWLRAACG